MAQIRLSQSSLRSWRRCRRMFYYRYIEKLQPKKLIRPLVFGSAVHRVLEYRTMGLSQDAAFKKVLEERSHVFTAELDEYDQIILDARRIMKAYDEYWTAQGDVEYVKIGKRRAEHEFEYDLGEGILIEGIIDTIAETDDGRRWLTEHKSHKKIPDEGYRMMDMQTMLYIDAARKALNIKRMAGILWDYLSSKSPAEPKLLKNGTLSKAAINTLPEIFEATIKKHGLKVRDYQDKLDELAAKRNQWFKRVFMPINNDAIKEIVEETKITGREIRRKAGVDLTRNINKDCSFCAYEKLCRAELFGMDADFIREREFRIKEAKNEVEADVGEEG